MKYLILFSIIILSYGCGEGAYAKDEKLIQAYEKGFMEGVNMCKRSIGLRIMDSLTLNTDSMATWEYDPSKANMKVYSVTFKYDSIMIINFDSSEIK